MKFPPAKRTLCLTLSSIGLLLLSSPMEAQAAPILYDFNAPGSLTNDFNRLNDQFSYWSEQEAGGLSDSGNLQIASSGSVNTMTSAVIAKEGISSSATEFTLSVFFQARDGGSTGYQWMIGVVPTSETAPSVNAGQASVQLAVGLNLGSAGYRWAEYNNTSIVGKNGSPDHSFALIADNWYYFEASFQRDGNNWTIDYSIHNANADGTLPSASLISATSGTFSNSLLSSATGFHPFLAVANNPAGRVINRFDNLTVTTIPETQTLASLAIGLALLGIHGMRKRIARSNANR